MPNTKSAIRQARLNERRRARGKAMRSQTKTSITEAEKLVFGGETEKAKEAVAAAVSVLDRAAERKIIHPKNAARRKSRLMKKLNRTLAAGTAKTETKEAKSK